MISQFEMVYLSTGGRKINIIENQNEINIRTFRGWVFSSNQMLSTYTFHINIRHLPMQHKKQD